MRLAIRGRGAEKVENGKTRMISRMAWTIGTRRMGIETRLRHHTPDQDDTRTIAMDISIAISIAIAPSIS